MAVLMNWAPLLPLSLVMVMLLFFKVPAREAVVIGILVTLGLGFLNSGIQALPLLEARLPDIVLITAQVGMVLWFGLFLFRLLEAQGMLTIMADGIGKLFLDREWLALVMVLGIGPAIESVAGFGTSVIVVAPILVRLGYSLDQAAMLGLLSQNMVPWGAMAAGTQLGAALGHISAQQLSARSADLLGPLLIGYAIAAMAVMKSPGIWKRLGWRSALLALGAAGVLAILSHVLSPALVGLLSGLAVTGLGCLLQPVRSHSHDLKIGNWGVVIVPYSFLTVLLMSTTLISSIAHWTATHGVIHWGRSSLSVLQNPGLYLGMAAVMAWWLRPLPWSRLGRILTDTCRPWQRVILVTLLYVALSQAMVSLHLTSRLSQELGGAGSWYVAAGLGLAAIGGYLTGSNTASNAMFMPLQLFAAHLTHISPLFVASLQNSAGSTATWASQSRTILASVAVGKPRTNHHAFTRQVMGWMAWILAGMLVIAASWFVA